MPHRAWISLCLLLPAACAVHRVAPEQALRQLPVSHRMAPAVGDVNGDGLLDLVLAHNGSFELLLGSERSFGRDTPEPRPLDLAVGVSCESPGQPRLVDVDADGDLDLVAIDAPLGSHETIVWFANDGKGRFGPKAKLLQASAAQPAWHGSASAFVLHDIDNDGFLDLLVATPRVLRFAGSRDGLAAKAADTGLSSRSGLCLLRADDPTRSELVTIEDSRLVAYDVSATPWTRSRVLGSVEGDAGQAQMQVGDWDLDGDEELLLSERVATPRGKQPAPAQAAPQAPTQAELQAERAAKARYAVLREQLRRLNLSRPPLGDAAAMDDRARRRQELQGQVDEARRSTRPDTAASPHSDQVSKLRVVDLR